MKARILLIEEDPQVAAAMQRILRERDHSVTLVLRPDDGLALAKRSSFDLVITHAYPVGPGGLDIAVCLRSKKPDLPILLTSLHEAPQPTQGITHFTASLVLGESVDSELVHNRVEALLNDQRLPPALQKPNTPFGPAPRNSGPLMGKSQAMQALFRDIDRISATSMPVLIRGVQGTGKKLAAQTVYLRSNRTPRPLVLVHCPELSKNSAESDLFGTEFPERHIGLLERTPGGTIILEEVGELTLECQERLARLLKSHCVQRIGSDILNPVDIRVLATTSQDLETAVAENLFREDLYLRLCVVCLDMPTLDERGEDIPELVQFFVRSLPKDPGDPDVQIQPEALVFLQNQRWTGNVSQLEQVIRQTFINARPSKIIALDHVLKAVALNQG